MSARLDGRGFDVTWQREAQARARSRSQRAGCRTPVSTGVAARAASVCAAQGGPATSATCRKTVVLHPVRSTRYAMFSN